MKTSGDIAFLVAGVVADLQEVIYRRGQAALAKGGSAIGEEAIAQIVALSVLAAYARRGHEKDRELFDSLASAATEALDDAITEARRVSK